MNNFFFFFFARRKMANECIMAATLQGGCCFNCVVPNVQLASAGVANLDCDSSQKLSLRQGPVCDSN